MGCNDMEADEGFGAASRQLSCFKISKRGRVRKVVREVYLRDDLPCGIKGCYLCGDPTADTGILRADERILVPDASCLLAFIDFVEEDPCIRNCVILSTVLNQVRSKSLQVYGRLRCLCENNTASGRTQRQKCFSMFTNEFFSQTFVQPTDDETAKDYEARCLFAAAQWLQRHASALAATTQPQGSDDLGATGSSRVVVLTRDPTFKTRSEAQGLEVQTIHEYLEIVKDIFPNSGEQLAQLGDMESRELDCTARPAIYEAHWTEQRIGEGLKSGSLLQGKLRMVPECSWKGLVFASGEEVRVVGRKNLNRALEGDVVAVEIIATDPGMKGKEQSESSVPAPEEVPAVAAELREVNEEAETFADEGDESGDFAPDGEPALSSDTHREARVVGIIRRGRREFCGTLKPIGGLKGLSMPCMASVERVFVPADRRTPNIIIKTRQSRELDGKRLVVAIDSWDRFQRLPRGHWIEVLGAFGDRKAEGNLILREQGITQHEFSQAAMRCLPPPDWMPSMLTDSERERRLDLRSVLTCSIDPPNCKDIDDALSLEHLPNGRVRVGVHIADVTYFLRPDTQLDLEAAERCTTVYLVERRTDMLPALLTTDLCSLVGGRERLAFSVLWEMDRDANVLNTSFHKTIIKSSAALTYQEAQSMIDDKRDKSPLAENLRELLRLSQIFRKRRMDAGGLQLASPDVQVIRQALAEPADGRSPANEGKDVSAETVEQETVDIALYQARETNKMVEDYMLLANVSVAKQIEKVFPQNSLLRRHPSPKTPSLETLKQLLQAKGITDFDYSSSKALSESLDRIAKHNPSLDFLLRIMTTRCMNQALYFSSADVVRGAASAGSAASAGGAAEDSSVSSFFHHYGLAAEIYTHFTSPIRRYADVIVHRLLAASLGLEPVPQIARNRERLTQQCELLNLKHRAAQIAGRQSVQFYVYLFFSSKGPQEVTAVITKIKNNGALVYVHEYGLEGVIFVNDELVFDPSSHQLVSKDKSIRYSVFSRVRVRTEAQKATDFRPTVKMTYLGPA